MHMQTLLGADIMSINLVSSSFTSDVMTGCVLPDAIRKARADHKIYRRRADRQDTDNPISSSFLPFAYYRPQSGNDNPSAKLLMIR